MAAPIVDPARAAYIKEIRAYYADEYAKAFGLGNVENPKARAYLDVAATNPNIEAWSHRNRIIRNIQIMKHTFTAHKTDNISVCFKATYNGTSCIYAFLHGRCAAGSRSKTAMSPQYVCAGPTYRSQDGEYRNRMIPWSQYVKVLEKYSPVFDIIEKLVLRKMTSGLLTFQTDFYYPIGCTYDESHLEAFVNDKRLPVKFFMMCWLHDYYNIAHKVMENHINPAYQYIIYQAEDRKVLDKIVAIANRYKPGYSAIMSRVSNYHPDIEAPITIIDEVQVGQKIFPLSAIEAVKTDDINFNVWREIYITNMASNLVLNLISPSFPFINNWFYIQNAHAGLFDNLAMHYKYTHGAIAADISAGLKALDKHNYVNEDRTKGPVSGKFFRLSRIIHKSIIYADSDIKLTDLAVCMTSEYVGRTLRDIPMLIAAKEHPIGQEMVFTDTEVFTTHMFEFIYAFYCMNSKIGILHGDLHMNNATISRLYQMFSFDGDQIMDREAKIAFVVGSDIWVFKHIGFFSNVIDFSRAIIGDYARIEHEFSQRFAEMYFKDQRIRMLQIMYHHFPKLVEKYRVQIESLLSSNFPLMFKIMTAIDAYVIMSNISAMFSIDDAFTGGRVKIAPGASKLLDALIDHAESLISANVRAAVEGRIGVPDDIEWPCLAIIRKNFTRHLLTDLETKDIPNIVEIFNANNDVVSDIEDYDTWGPLLALDKEIELRKKHHQEIHAGIAQWTAYKAYDESDVMETLTSKYRAREKDVLQFEAWMME